MTSMPSRASASAVAMSASAIGPDTEARSALPAAEIAEKTSDDSAANGVPPTPALRLARGRRIEGGLEPMRPIERARSIQRVSLANRLRDLDLAIRAHLLADEGHREERREVIRTEWAEGSRMEVGRRRDRQVGRDVVPAPGDVVLVEDELRPTRHHLGHGRLTV